MPSSGRELLSRTWRTITESIFHPEFSCALCGHEIDPACDEVLCRECRERISVIGKDRCERCGAYCPDFSDLCLSCTYRLPEFDLARSYAEYDGAARELMLAYKESNFRWLTDYFCERLLEVYGQGELTVPDVVTAVPASHFPALRRGFAHVERLAEQFCRAAGLTYRQVLVRVREGKQQKSVPHRLRAENVRGSFAADEGCELSGKSILIIDDIKTTGATVNECAGVLKKAGAARVEVLTYASVTPRFQSM